MGVKPIGTIQRSEVTAHWFRYATQGGKFTVLMSWFSIARLRFVEHFQHDRPIALRHSHQHVRLSDTGYAVIRTKPDWGMGYLRMDGFRPNDLTKRSYFTNTSCERPVIKSGARHFCIAALCAKEVLMKKLLVFGERGFVARRMIERISKDRHDIEAVGAQADITDRSRLKQTLKREKPDIVLNLAGVSSVSAASRDPERAWLVNCEGARILGSEILETSPQTGLIQVSSGEVYGERFLRDGYATEDDALEPIGAYAASKAASEMALNGMKSSGLDLVIFRPLNHIGPGQAGGFVVSNFAQQFAKMKSGAKPPILHVGNIDVRRDFLDVQDVCSVYLLAIDAFRSFVGETFNVSSESTISLSDIIRMMSEITGVDVEIVVDEGRRRSFEIPNMTMSSSRLRNLGWKPVVDIRTTLCDTIAYWEALSY